MALERSSATHATHATDFEAVGSTYFQERELKKGAAGWVLLVGLGVAYVHHFYPIRRSGLTYH